MTTYYNDNDPFCCAWLRELIKAGLIPAGEVDQRSITDVQPDDLKPFTQCHFFAGIGGWAYALQLAGWPEYRGVWTGSCPCQPFSCAGKRQGTADKRHLWPEFHRLISQCHPPTVFGEQVESKAGREWLSGIRTDLEGVGYAVGGADLCAASVGAPHRRQRLFWVADATEQREQRDATSQRVTGRPCERESGFDSTDGRLADAELARRQAGTELSLDARGQSEPGCVRGGGMEHSQSDGRGERGTEPGGRCVAGGCEHGGMVQPNGAGLQPRNETATTAGHRSSTIAANFWSDAIWIPTSDPRTGETKMRRLSPQPEVFPLAPRLPGRVGMLRGAGNAIVPQVAAEFILAFLEASAVASVTP